MKKGWRRWAKRRGKEKCCEEERVGGRKSLGGEMEGSLGERRAPGKERERARITDDIMKSLGLITSINTNIHFFVPAL